MTEASQFLEKTYFALNSSKSLLRTWLVEFFFLVCKVTWFIYILFCDFGISWNGVCQNVPLTTL